MKIKMWYQKPKFWQLKKKRYYRDILTTTKPNQAKGVKDETTS